MLCCDDAEESSFADGDGFHILILSQAKFLFNTDYDGGKARERTKESDACCDLRKVHKQWQCYKDFGFRTTAVPAPTCTFVPLQFIASPVFS